MNHEARGSVVLLIVLAVLMYALPPTWWGLDSNTTCTGPGGLNRMEGIPPGPPMLVHPYVMLTDEERQAAQAAAAAAAADETRDDMDHGQQQARQDDPGSNQSRVNYFGEGFSSRSATDGARRGWATDVSSDTAKLEPPPEPYPQVHVLLCPATRT